MGFMTEVSFLNDRWHEIKEAIQKDPGRFVQEIQVAMNGKPVYGLPGEGGRREYLGKETPGEVRLGVNASLTMYPSHHADDPRLYLAWQNQWLLIDPYSIKDQYGARLDNPDDHVLEVLEKDLRQAEQALDWAKKFLREKREQQEALKVARSL